MKTNNQAVNEETQAADQGESPDSKISPRLLLADLGKALVALALSDSRELPAYDEADLAVEAVSDGAEKFALSARIDDLSGQLRMFNPQELKRSGLSDHFIGLMYYESHDFILSRLELFQFLFEIGAFSSLIELHNGLVNYRKEIVCFFDGEKVVRYFYTDQLKRNIPKALVKQIAEGIVDGTGQEFGQSPFIFVIRQGLHDLEWVCDEVAEFSHGLNEISLPDPVVYGLPGWTVGKPDISLN